jgi:hypothetical protein
MLRLRRRAFVFMACVAFVSATFHHAWGQRMRPPHVYNPRAYSNTRMRMSNRAAARAVIKKRHKAKARKRRSQRKSAG